MTTPSQALAALAALCTPLLGACRVEPPPPATDPVAVATWQVVLPPSGGVAGGDSGRLELPGAVGGLTLLRQARLVEFSDGVATLEAVLACPTDPDRRWRLRLDFAGLLKAPGPGEELSEAAGAVLARARSTAGAAVDVSDWRFYALASGELVGLDRCAGARLQLTSGYPALRLGEHAAGVPGLGATCDLFVRVSSQPHAGEPIPGDEVRCSLRLGLAEVLQRDPEAAARAAGPGGQACPTGQSPFPRGAGL